MEADDERHGTNKGYNAGCHEDCCKRAHARYKNLHRLGRERSYIDNCGTIRRIQALAALGYSISDLSHRLGFTRSYLSQILKGSSVRSDNAARIADMFEGLSMTLPDHPLAVRARNHAQRQGWAPPLAWDDIDDPAEVADYGTGTKYRDLPIDDVAIERALAGDRSVRLTQAEKIAATALWLKRGGTYVELETRTGWRVGRYTTKDEAA